MDGSGYRRYERFFHAPCQEIVEWQDDQSEARGWLVINSMRGGAAGGGTRMRAGATLDEAIFLAKTMEIKFGVSGPPIGGAKSVLSFAPKDQEEKWAVLRRWFRHIEPWLKSRYGTGGDQNVNETEVTHLTGEAIGLRHPQEGIVHGYGKLDPDSENRVLAQLSDGVDFHVGLRGREDKVPLADVITGFGVVKSLATFYAATGGSLEGKRVLIEGFGAVGGSTAYYLHEMGAHVVGVISFLPGSRKFRWHADPAGLDIPGLFAHREGSSGTDLPAAGGAESTDPSAFWQQDADIFIPAATSYTIDSRRIEILRHLGVQVIACGANTPFADRDLGSCAVQREADRAFSIIPDFIANCGMARTFAYLMDDGAEVTERAIEADVAATIRNALQPILEGYSGGGGLLDRAFSRYVPETAGD